MTKNPQLIQLEEGLNSKEDRLQKKGEEAKSLSGSTNQNGLNSGIKISPDVEVLLKDAYYDPSSPTSFSGAEKLYQILKKWSIQDFKEIY